MGVPIAPSEGQFFTGKDMPNDIAVTYTKMAEPIEMLFGGAH